MNNEESFDYLKNKVKYTGFGEGLEKQLKENIAAGQPSFTLQHSAEFGKDRTDSTLHFRRSEESGLYFFNRYDMALKKGDAEKDTSQTFYVSRDNTVTAKEAYNLLDGRSVNKDLVNKQGEKYNSWVKLDFNDADANGNFRMKHFHENYGFNLTEALAKHDLKELREPTESQWLEESLKKGNRHAITFIKDGEERKGFVQANPQFKSVKLLDESGKEIRQSTKQAAKQDTAHSEKQDVSLSEKPASKQSQKRNTKQVEESDTKNNTKQTRKRGVRAS